MGHVIAIAGKGGTGKTTIAALLTRLVKEEKLGSCLAVDADPNSNLADLLGVEVNETIGEILDAISANPDCVPKGMPKDRFIEYRVQSAVKETEGFDLIAMGKPEGPGCYCYVNNVLRAVMAKLINDYDYVIIDNEAGLEHLSRRTTRSAEILLVVSDASVVGLKAAKRISDIVKELKINIKEKTLLVNRWDKEVEAAKLEALDLDYLGNIPVDGEIARFSVDGMPLMNLSSQALAITALRKIGEKILCQARLC